jgi:hypothetical protein
MAAEFVCGRSPTRCVTAIGVLRDPHSGGHRVHQRPKLVGARLCERHAPPQRGFGCPLLGHVASFRYPASLPVRDASTSRLSLGLTLADTTIRSAGLGGTFFGALPIEPATLPAQTKAHRKHTRTVRQRDQEWVIHDGFTLPVRQEKPG